MGFWQTFKDFKPSTQFFLVVSFIGGALLCAALWATDQNFDVQFGNFDVKRPDTLRDYGHEWLNTHAFIPNILAGFTSFLVGAPVAAVILATFTIEREVNSTLANVNGMSNLAWRNFLTAFDKFYTIERYLAVTVVAPRVQSEHDKAQKAVYSVISFIRTGQTDDECDQTGNRKSSDFLHAIEVHKDTFHAGVDEVRRALKDHETINTQWSALVGAWQILDQFVRLQRLEQRLDWFVPEDPEVDAEIRKWLSRNPNPLTDFIHLHGYAATEKFGASTMVNAANAVRNYSSLSEIELRSELESSSSKFGHSAVCGYEALYKEASFFLERLAFCVSRIRNSNWPKCAEVPSPANAKCGRARYPWNRRLVFALIIFGYFCLQRDAPPAL